MYSLINHLSMQMTLLDRAKLLIFERALRAGCPN